MLHDQSTFKSPHFKFNVYIFKSSPHTTIEQTCLHTTLGDDHMTQQNRSNNSNELLVPQAAGALEQMKYEIASEFGVNLGPETTSRANGSVGGEITKRLVRLAQQSMNGQFH